MHDDETAFSRAARSVDGSHPEKLTIVTPLSVRLTESQALDVQGLADLRGMDKGEYIRHLVAQDKLEQHRIWLARNQLFSTLPVGAMNTAANSVGRES
jgi:hypothetical protein